MVRKRRRVIVRRVDNLGDIVIALPVLNALRNQYANCELTLMVKPEHRALCAHLCDRFIAPSNLDGFAETAARYDLAFNVDYFGPGNHATQRLTRGTVNQINALPGRKTKPIALHLTDGLAAYGFAIPRNRIPRFPTTRTLKAEGRKWLSAQGFGQKKELWIAVHIGSRHQMKCWPPERFALLCRWLQRAFDAKLIFIGTSKEYPRIREIEQSLPPNCSCVMIDEPLDLVAVVLSETDLAIGNDSGVGHLASAVLTPTVSIFGPTAPALWRPAGAKAIVVFKRRKRTNSPGNPTLSVTEVKQGVLLALNEHVRRDRNPILDRLRISQTLEISRQGQGVILRSGKRGPACLVDRGWRRVSAILRAVERAKSFSQVLRAFPDAEPLLNLLIVHGIIVQGKE